MSHIMLGDDAFVDTLLAEGRSKSGPNTLDGKSRSRRNAARHKLSGSGPVAFEILDDANNDEWNDDLDPDGPHQLHLVRVVAFNAAQVELCQAREAELIRLEQVEAAKAWHTKRNADALKLSKKIRKQPRLTVGLLLETVHGCNLMISRWEQLEEAYHAQGESWTAEQEATALDLLGVEPELRPAEWLFKVGKNAPNPDGRLSRIEDQLDFVKMLRDEVAGLDAHQRHAAVRGFASVTSREVRLTRRYKAESHKRMATALAELAALKASASSGATSPRMPAAIAAVIAADAPPMTLQDPTSVVATPIPTVISGDEEFVSGSLGDDAEGVSGDDGQGVSGDENESDDKPSKEAAEAAPVRKTWSQCTLDERRAISAGWRAEMVRSTPAKTSDESKDAKGVKELSRRERTKRNEMKMARKKK